MKGLSDLSVVALCGCMVVFGVALCIAVTLWADWVVRVLFHKDYNDWGVFCVVLLSSMLTPEKLQGWQTVVLLMATIYIWWLM